MGRDGGGDVVVFPNMEAAKKHVEEKRKENKLNVQNYECDSTDSGRGNACENDGGFRYFDVVHDSRTFCSKEEAETVLSQRAESVDPGDDSIVYVIGTFKTLSEDAAATKKKETEEFVGTMMDTLKIPEGESFFNGASDEGFVECRLCHSKLSRPYLVKKKLHLREGRTAAGVCPVCDSNVTERKDECVITSDEWNSLTGKKFCETGASLKRDRTLFNEKHSEECDDRFMLGKAMKESFKKRKEDLDSQTTGTSVMVVSAWTSAHF